MIPPPLSHVASRGSLQRARAIESATSRPERWRPRTFVAALLAGLALLAAPSPASASPPPEAESSQEHQANELVRIRVKPKSRKLASRLGAELDVMGFVVEPLAIPNRAPTLGPDLLDRLDGASAAIEIVVEGGRADLWVADGRTGKTLIRRFDLREEPERGDPRTLAIASVELLIASRLEVGDERTDLTAAPVIQQTEGERPPEDATPEPYEFPLRGAISLAPMLGASAGGPGLITHIEVAGRWAPLRRFALRFSAWIPSYGNRVANEQGAARLFLAMAFVEPQLRLPGGVAWFHPELGVGLGGALTSISAEANAGFRGTATLLGGFAGHTHLGLGFQISERIWVRLDGYVGIIQPQPRVVFIDTVVSRLGLPFASGSLGLELWL